MSNGNSLTVSLYLSLNLLGGQAKAAIRGHLKTGHSEKP
jgi:hypothetical protein